MVREKQAELPENEDLTEDEYIEHIRKVLVAHAQLRKDEPLFQCVIDGIVYLVCGDHLDNPEADL